MFYWKSAGNLLKAFHYTIDGAAAFLVVDRSMKALALLDEVEQMIVKQEELHFRDYVVTDEERARIESLKGQVRETFWKLICSNAPLFSSILLRKAKFPFYYPF